MQGEEEAEDRKLVTLATQARETQTRYPSPTGPVRWLSFHRIIHRHPGLLSFPSRSLAVPLAIRASSSSTTSCGLTVIWTTCGVSPIINRPSGSSHDVSISLHGDEAYGYHLSSELCRLGVFRNGLGVLSWDWRVWVPILKGISLADVIWATQRSNCSLAFPPVPPYKFLESVDAHIYRIVIRHVNIPLLKVLGVDLVRVSRSCMQ